MPKKRNPENIGLPERWSMRRGKPYYQVPAGQEKRWDGKKLFKLGDTLPEAYAEWARRLEYIENAKTVGELLDRYALEVLPAKAANTQDIQILFVKQLKSVFGNQLLGDITPQDIYIYVDKRSRKKEVVRNGKNKISGGASVARREIALLSSAYTKAVQWGFISSHPFKGEIRLEGEKPRTRYVEDWEIIAVMSLKDRRDKDKASVVQSYIRLKLLTGLRQADLLRLRLSDCREDGIHVATSKTGKPVIYEWTESLRSAVEEAKRIRPVSSLFIFCNRRGQSYVNERDKTYGWKSIWKRFIDRAIEETDLEERFTEHDLRAKCASDAATLEHAQQLLAHTDSKTTRRIYRRKPERITPAE